MLTAAAAIASAGIAIGAHHVLAVDHAACEPRAVASTCPKCDHVCHECHHSPHIIARGFYCQECAACETGCSG